MNQSKRSVFIALFLILPATAFAAKTNFKFDNSVALNMMRGEIPAPIETTRFQDDKISGDLAIDFNDLAKTRGTIKIDLSDIQAHTFGDNGKNTKQTEHMKNWFEIGPDVSEDTRKKYQWATFEIKSIKSVAPKTFNAAKVHKDEIGAARSFNIEAVGAFTIHGITKPKTVRLKVVIYNINKDGKRYKDAKRLVAIRTRSPMKISLKDHDIKPRDATGSFLSKALSVVGLKLSDTAEISLDLRAYEPK